MFSSSSTESLDSSAKSITVSLPETLHKKAADKITAIIPDVLKPGLFTSRKECIASLMHYKQHHPSIALTNIEVKTEQGSLIAYKLTLAAEVKSTLAQNKKKALIYVCGNGEHVSDMIPIQEQLLRDVSKQSKNIGKPQDIALFMQDYRGRGTNQTDENEDFNKYPLQQDAKDIAHLVKKLVADGYAHENITIMGHSLGSAVTLWAMDILTQENNKFKEMNVVSDRGYGDPEHILFLHHIKKIDETLKKQLQEKGMMPKKPLADIAASLPNFLALMATDDGVIPESLHAGLVTTLKKSTHQEKFQGHTFTLENNDKKQDAHNVAYDRLNLKMIPELQPHVLVTAMMHKEPIKIRFAPKYMPAKKLTLLNLDEITNGLSQTPTYGWVLKNSNPKETIACPPLPHILNNSSITTSTDLATQLFDHCTRCAAESKESKQGKSHISSNLFFASLIYWTSGDEIEKTCEILQLLCQDNGPDVESLEKLNKEKGPQQRGQLRTLMDKVIATTNEYKEIQKLNTWIKPAAPVTDTNKKMRPTTAVAQLKT